MLIWIFQLVLFDVELLLPWTESEIELVIVVSVDDELVTFECWKISANFVLSTAVVPKSAWAISGIIWIVNIGTVVGEDVDEPSVVVNTEVTWDNGATLSVSREFARVIVTRFPFPFGSSKTAVGVVLTSVFVGLRTFILFEVVWRRIFFVEFCRCCINDSSSDFLCCKIWTFRSRKLNSSTNWASL